jgi:hypothetical protein
MARQVVHTARAGDKRLFWRQPLILGDTFNDRLRRFDDEVLNVGCSDGEPFIT